MIKEFKYGFNYKGFLFGWYNGFDQLYRLPSTVKKRSYPIKKLNIIKINKQEGYRVARAQKTILQLKELTERIDYVYVLNGVNGKDCPF